MVVAFSFGDFAVLIKYLAHCCACFMMNTPMTFTVRLSGLGFFLFTFTGFGFFGCFVRLFYQRKIHLQ